MPLANAVWTVGQRVIRSDWWRHNASPYKFTESTPKSAGLKVHALNEGYHKHIVAIEYITQLY
jgi:hypothetical protein